MCGANFILCEKVAWGRSNPASNISVTVVMAVSIWYPHVFMTSSHSGKLRGITGAIFKFGNSSFIKNRIKRVRGEERWENVVIPVSSGRPPRRQKNRSFGSAPDGRIGLSSSGT